MKSVFERLQEWYLAQCNGDWEHRYKIRIETIDNPGWTISIELAETALADVSFEEFQENYEDELNWLTCSKVGTTWCGYGGSLQLERLISLFLKWAEVSVGSHDRGNPESEKAGNSKQESTVDEERRSKSKTDLSASKISITKLEE
ncbi:MAG: immunity 53 family protein [Chthonomonadaceae bacterium]|nr:immunity 53 family protein [Chthonomonadaceae bacterium]